MPEPPIFPCGGPGQPACPPVECIQHVNGTLTATINGVEYALTPTGNPTSADLDTFAAEEQAVQGTGESS